MISWFTCWLGQDWKIPPGKWQLWSIISFFVPTMPLSDSDMRGFRLPLLVWFDSVQNSRNAWLINGVSSVCTFAEVLSFTSHVCSLIPLSRSCHIPIRSYILWCSDIYLIITVAFNMIVYSLIQFLHAFILFLFFYYWFVNQFILLCVGGDDRLMHHSIV